MTVTIARRSVINLNGDALRMENRYLNNTLSGQRVLDNGLSGSAFITWDTNSYPTGSGQATRIPVQLACNGDGSATTFVVKWIGRAKFSGFGTITGSARTHDFRGSVGFTFNASDGTTEVTNGRGTFSTTLSAAQNATVVLTNTTTSPNVSLLVIVRADEEDEYDAGNNFRGAANNQAGTFCRWLRDLNPLAIRVMDASNTVASHTAQWGCRPPQNGITNSARVNATSYLVGDNGSGNGQITGTNTYAAAAYPAQPDPVNYVDGEQCYGYIINSSSGASTLNVGGRGDKPILNSDMSATGSGSITGSAGGTFVYSATLGAAGVWIYQAGLPTPGIPIESAVELSNVTGIPLWYCFPHLATDDFVTQFSNYIAANYTLPVVYGEYSNEVWNPALNGPNYATNYSAKMAQKIFTSPPIGSGSYADISAYYGYRMHQISDIVRPILGGKIQIVHANAGAWGTPATVGGATSLTAIVENLRFQNSNYALISGENAPINFAEIVSYALYYPIINIPNYNDNGGWSAAGDINGLKTAVDNYLLGTAAGYKAAFDWAYNDLLNSNNFQCAVSPNGSRFSNWNTLAQSYGKKVILYEMNQEVECPSILFGMTQSPFCAVSNFTPILNASMVVTTSSQRVAIPSGATMLIVYIGQVMADHYIKLGDSTVTATNLDTAVVSGWRAFSVGANTHIAILGSGTDGTLNRRAHIVGVNGSSVLDGDTGALPGYNWTGNTDLAGENGLGEYPLPQPTSAGMRVPLPSGTSCLLYNYGTVNVYAKLGNSAVVNSAPVTNDTLIAPNGGWTCFTIGANTHVALATSSLTGSICVIGGTGSISDLTTGTNVYGGQNGSIDKFLRASDGYYNSQQYYDSVRLYLDYFYLNSQSMGACIYGMCTGRPWDTFSPISLTSTWGGNTMLTPYQNWNAHKDWNNQKVGILLGQVGFRIHL